MPRLSRWQRSSAGACVSATSLDTGTAATIARAINATRVSGRDANPHVVDIDLRSVTEGDVITAVSDRRGNVIIPGRLKVEGKPQFKHTHIEVALQRIG